MAIQAFQRFLVEQIPCIVVAFRRTAGGVRRDAGTNGKEGSRSRDGQPDDRHANAPRARRTGDCGHGACEECFWPAVSVHNRFVGVNELISSPSFDPAGRGRSRQGQGIGVS